jgi:hypothetical protein
MPWYMDTKSIRSFLLCLSWSVLILWAAAPSSARADAMLFTGSSGTLSASALFELVGGNHLNITLTNTSAADVLLPADVLTGLFFNSVHSLSPMTAALNDSISVYKSSTDPGDGWGFASRVNAQGYGNAISATGAVPGLGLSNFSHEFNKLGGVDFGILSAGDKSETGNTGVKKRGPLFNDSIVFTLNTSPGFSLQDLGSTVMFQYGSALNEPHYVGEDPPINPPTSPVSEPASLILFGSGLAGVALYVWRRNRYAYATRQARTGS